MCLLRSRLTMAGVLAATAVLPLRAAPPEETALVATANVPVRHAKASRVVAQLLNWNERDAPERSALSPATLPGLKTLSADDKAHRIQASGDKASIARLRELVKLLDQPAPEMKLRVAITSAPYVPGSDATPATTMLVQTEVTVSNLETIAVPLNADKVAVQSIVRAHINGDRSVSLAYSADARWRISLMPQVVSDNRQATQSTRRLKLGEVSRSDLAILNVGTNGDGPRRQYYLELTPVAVKIP